MHGTIRSWTWGLYLRRIAEPSPRAGEEVSRPFATPPEGIELRPPFTRADLVSALQRTARFRQLSPPARKILLTAGRRYADSHGWFTPESDVQTREGSIVLTGLAAWAYDSGVPPSDLRDALREVLHAGLIHQWSHEDSLSEQELQAMMENVDLEDDENEVFRFSLS